jgi:hypothetical protein
MQALRSTLIGGKLALNFNGKNTIDDLGKDGGLIARTGGEFQHFVGVF